MRLFCKTRWLRKYVSDETFVLWQYERTLHQELNLKHPRTFNEKVQWLKLYWRNPLMTRCADKYAVRDFVAARVGPEILKRLHGVYRRPEEIDLAALPDRFMLKVNHGSDQNIPCRNKAELDWAATAQQLRKFLRQRHYHNGREWSYKDIPPRILCEEYLLANPLMDYNFFCFDGVPRVVEVISDRLGSPHASMFDLDWNRLERQYTLVPPLDPSAGKPPDFHRMVEYAAKLAKGFPFARVDFLHDGRRIYFGEITFYPRNGMNHFVPRSFDDFLGTMLELPKPWRANSTVD